MDIPDVRVFLALCRYKNFTKAAQAVGMTQSALSQRLRRLEAEFEVQLIVRAQGKRQVELTPEGEQLFPVATQWEDLYMSARSLLRTGPRLPLAVCATNSINSYLFSPFLEQYLNQEHGVELTCFVNHTWEIFDLLAGGMIDIGLCNRPPSHLYKDIRATEFYQERYLLLAAPAFTAPLSNKKVLLRDLDVAQEIFVDIDSRLTHWHETIWGKQRPLLIHNCSDSLPFILRGTRRWVILPYSIARFIEQNHGLVTYELAEQPPSRVCYAVHLNNTHSHKEAARRSLLSELYAYFSDKNKI